MTAGLSTVATLASEIGCAGSIAVLRLSEITGDAAFYEAFAEPTVP